MPAKPQTANKPVKHLPISASWCQAVLVAFLFGFLVVMNVYFDEHAMDISLMPRLRGLCAGLFAMVLFLLLPPVARCLDFSVLRSPLILCYGAFSALCFFSLLWALNPTAGFTDAFKTFGCFVFLCLLCLLLPTLAHWKEQLLRAVICGALLSAGWGYYEMFAMFGFGLHGRASMESVLGTMGNVNLYAGFLILILPFCLCAVVLLRGLWCAAASIAALSTALMVVLLQTRAAYLGMAASGLSAVLLCIVFAPKLGIGAHRRRTMVGAMLAIAFALAAFYWLAPDTNPVASRLRTMASGTQDASISKRLMAWEITTEMIADHFPLGVGTGNFTMRLDEYFNERLGFQGDNANWIYPHNDYLWVSAEQGLLGILLYLALFLITFGICLRRMCQDCPLRDAWLCLTLIAALIAYLVDSAFGFPLSRVSHQLYLAMIFAIAVLLSTPEAGRGLPVVVAGKYPRRLLVGALPALVVLALGFSYARAAIKQEYYLSVVFALESEKMWPAALRVLRGAESPWKTTDPFATPWAYHEARVLQRMGADDEEVLAALEKAYTQNPNRLHVINDLGAFYGKTGRIEKAIELFTKTAQRYPNQIVAIENLAQCYIDQDDYASALKILEEIPEDKRTEAVRTKIIGCRQALEEERSEKAGDR